MTIKETIVRAFAILHKERGELDREFVADCDNVEQFVMRKFGTTPEGLAKHDLSVEEVTADAPAAMPVPKAQENDAAVAAAKVEVGDTVLNVVPAVDMHDGAPSSSEPTA